MPQPIQIFRSGTHTAMSGAVLSFSENDLSASANAYDPALHEAPLVIGHPRHDAPAYGWVSRLQYGDGALEAMPDQLDAEFSEMVRKGRFKKISASFYPPAHPGNPKPGVYYLRHVGFLGAQPPAVKGLKAVEFASDDEGIVTVEFSENERWGWKAVATLLRNLRDKWIERDGVDSADQVLPTYLISEIDNAAEDDDADSAMPAYSEQTTEPEEPAMPTPPAKDTSPTADFTEREQQLLAREQEIAARENAIAQQEQERQTREAANFAEQLASTGRILPRHQAGVAALLTSLGDEALEFGEGDGAYQGTSAAFLREFLEALPPQVDFSERTAVETEEQTVDFAAPAGYTVDQEALAMHRKIVAYQRANNVDYATAAQAVAG